MGCGTAAPTQLDYWFDEQSLDVQQAALRRPPALGHLRLRLSDATFLQQAIDRGSFRRQRSLEHRFLALLSDADGLQVDAVFVADFDFLASLAADQLIDLEANFVGQQKDPLLRSAGPLFLKWTLQPTQEVVPWERQR